MNPIESEINEILDKLNEKGFTLYEKRAIVTGLKNKLVQENKELAENSIKEAINKGEYGGFGGC